MPFEEILKKSFKYPWQNRALWFYGVLLAIFSGFSGITNNLDYDDISNLASRFDQQTLGAIVVGSAVIGIIFAIVGLIVSSWAQAAIIKGTAAEDNNKSIARKEMGKVGKRNILKLIQLNFFIPVAIAIVLAALIAVVVLVLMQFPQQTAIYVGIPLAVLFVLVLIPVAVYFGEVWMLAAREIVLDEKRVIKSIKDSMELIKGNFWYTFLFSFVIGIIAGMASLVLLLPFVAIALTVVASLMANVMAGAVVGGIIGLLYLVFYIIALGYFHAVGQAGLTVWWLNLKRLKTAK